MGAEVVLPLISAIISFVFALNVLDQYLHRRRPHQLVWTVGLVWYGVSTFTQHLGAANGWDPFLYRLWYLAGAYLVAAYLGMGTIYLMAPRRLAHGIMAVLVVASLVAAALVFSAPVDAARLPHPGENPTADAFPPFPVSPVRVLTPIFNIFGTIPLVGGALWSAWRLYRQGAMPYRVISNTLIAGGALLVAGASALTRFGIPAGLAVGQLLGVVLIFTGFLVSIEVFDHFRVPFTNVVLARRS